MKKAIGRCKYCGAKVSKGNDICTQCYTKRRLIRKLQQMIRDTFERVKKQ